ncbi:hypothetical protein UO65_0915 [Actinokineospora spheciospongiae]|uniref:Uncharacterized protein n=1 Tax=Actinokineospora spheciospongiae TaxID=909613 RepID=W7IS57_9PSEU|nr:hypothetical protein UO65_0915 [Actinokineospora spheciospongiae]
MQGLGHSGTAIPDPDFTRWEELPTGRRGWKRPRGRASADRVSGFVPVPQTFDTDGVEVSTADRGPAVPEWDGRVPTSGIRCPT